VSELLPCPFCGGEAIITRVEAHDHTPALKAFIPDIEPAEDTHWPECPNCGAARSCSNSRGDAIKQWNTRHPAPRPLSRNELAEAIHRGRFKDREPTPLGSDRLDREYAFRIADSVIAATKSAPAVASSLPSGESEPLVTTAHAGADTHQSSTAMTKSAEPVEWQVRCMHDKGHKFENEWCEWRFCTKKWFDQVNADLAAGVRDRMQTRALYATPPSDAAREALAGLLPWLEDAETKVLVGDEGCVWAVEMVRAALSAPLSAWPTRETIAAEIDPVAFDPISLNDTHPGWESRRERALETADRICALSRKERGVEAS